MSSFKLYLGSGFGLGLLPKAPGTWGSLGVLLPLFLLIQTDFILAIPVFAFIMILFSIWASPYCEEVWGKDPSKYVLDEFAGQSVAFITIASFGDPKLDLLILFLGFILFRIFDILKPFGIKKVEGLPSPWGILVDDVLAGLYALICLEILIFIFQILKIFS